MSIAWWLVSSLCLPLTFPVIIYKLIFKMQLKNEKSYLQNKVVLITGASSGLGEALAHTFYSSGCRVVLAARRLEELMRVKVDLLSLHPTVPTHPPVVMQLDLSDLNSLPAAVEKINGIYGAVDILINNGGMSYRGEIINTKIDVDIKLMLVNYFGQVALTKAVLPKMISRGSGHVVFISSVQGRISIPHRSAYAASKHALQAFADCLRAELAEKNICVTVINPGYINTALSVNSVTENGGQYGVTDPTTASGYSSTFVSEKILTAVVWKDKERAVAPWAPRIAMFLRFMFPSLYFWIMSRRAQKSVN